jgi:magnesium transporter
MSPDAPVNSGPHSALFDSIRELDPNTAAERLAEQSDETIGRVLSELPPGRAIEVLGLLPAERHDAIAAAAPFGEGPVWLIGRHYEEGTVGRLMESAPAVFGHDTTIREVIAALRGIINERMVIYVFVTENDGTLVGVVAFRELLFATPEQKLSDVMLRHPFVLRPDMPLVEAMREVVTRHYPIYPVCDAQDRLLGMVRGQVLFEHQAFEISAQAGSMVGVEREERLATPWLRSLRLRHPWLQLNLLTAFVAAAVVGYFQGTLDQIVLLAVFLPVLAGQSGNTGCQTLAVTLRGMTLGELRAGRARPLVVKECLLGLANGTVVGFVAGIGMYLTARSESAHNALGLAAVVMAAMTVSCAVSGAAGALIPLTLKRLGADPATASSIFLTTATDVVSMGCFLGLATLFLI